MDGLEISLINSIKIELQLDQKIVPSKSILLDVVKCLGSDRDVVWKIAVSLKCYIEKLTLSQILVGQFFY